MMLGMKQSSFQLKTSPVTLTNIISTCSHPISHKTSSFRIVMLQIVPETSCIILELNESFKEK